MPVEPKTKANSIQASQPKALDHEGWLIARKGSWTGPFSTTEVVTQIGNGGLGWADYAGEKSGDLKWRRICDWPAFSAFLPAEPEIELLREIRSVLPPTSVGEGARSPRHSIWYLEFQGSEFGPLNSSEVEVILKSGKLRGTLKGWREGMEDWVGVGEIPELMDLMGAGRYGPATKSNQPGDERRQIQRVPLIATVRFSVTGESGMALEGPFVGICRDVSAHGMLILSNRIPVGAAELRLEVIPMGATGLESFLAEAELVRALSDYSGFSVRFIKIRSRVAQAIEKYVEKSV